MSSFDLLHYVSVVLLCGFAVSNSMPAANGLLWVSQPLP
jgi:hypothetical protein